MTKELKPFSVLCAELEAILLKTAHIEPWNEEKTGKDAVRLYLENIYEPALDKIEEIKHAYITLDMECKATAQREQWTKKVLKQIGEIANV